MFSSGTVEIDGKTYTWESPTILQLATFEGTIGPISDLKVVNSVQGRAYLASLALQKHHPDLLPSVIMSWPVSVLPELWPLIQKAFPLWGMPDEDKPAASPEISSPPAPSASDGLPATPSESA